MNRCSKLKTGHWVASGKCVGPTGVLEEFTMPSTKNLQILVWAVLWLGDGLLCCPKFFKSVQALVKHRQGTLGNVNHL